MTQKAFPKPVGIKDVAQCAGVSISTVSNALSGKKNISPQLKKRVPEAVNQLEYETNPIGRQLKTGRSQQIAFLVPSITSIFFPDVLKSMQSAADAAGYTVSVFGTKGNVAQERRTINLLRSQGFDGVFLDSCADVDKPETAEYLDFLHAVNFDNDAPMRIICVETAISPKLDAVVINDADGIALMTEYLIRSGRRRFAHIAAPNQYFHAKNRRKGFLTALMLNSIPAAQAVIAEGNFTCRSGYNAMAEILDSGKTVDAVVCGNDQMAIGALYCLKERGIRVPEDMQWPALTSRKQQKPRYNLVPRLLFYYIRIVCFSPLCFFAHGTQQCRQKLPEGLQRIQIQMLTGRMCAASPRCQCHNVHIGDCACNLAGLSTAVHLFGFQLLSRQAIVHLAAQLLQR